MINDNNHSWPPFAANILIELWKNGQNDDDYSVKIYYCERVNIKIKIYLIPQLIVNY